MPCHIGICHSRGWPSWQLTCSTDGVQQLPVVVRTSAVEPDHAYMGIASITYPVLEERGALRAADSLVDRARLLAGRALAYEGLAQWEAALNDYNSALDLAKQAGWGFCSQHACPCS